MKKLKELQAHVDTMRVGCDDAETQLQISNEASKTLLERAGTLRRERCAAPARAGIRDSSSVQARSGRAEIHCNFVFSSFHFE